MTTACFIIQVTWHLICPRIVTLALPDPLLPVAPLLRRSHVCCTTPNDLTPLTDINSPSATALPQCKVSVKRSCKQLVMRSFQFWIYDTGNLCWPSGLMGCIFTWHNMLHLTVIIAEYRGKSVPCDKPRTDAVVWQAFCGFHNRQPHMDWRQRWLPQRECWGLMPVVW